MADTDPTTPLIIDGYVMHWLTNEERTELVNLVESDGEFASGGTTVMLKTLKLSIIIELPCK